MRAFQFSKSAHPTKRIHLVMITDETHETISTCSIIFIYCREIIQYVLFIYFWSVQYWKNKYEIRFIQHIIHDEWG